MPPSRMLAAYSAQWGEGTGGTPDFYAGYERDRVAVCDRAPAPARDKGGRLTHEGPPDGLQTPRHGAGPVATARRRAPAAACSRWCRFRGRRAAGTQTRQGTSASRVEHPSRLAIHLSASTRKLGRLSELIVDRANLSRCDECLGRHGRGSEPASWPGAGEALTAPPPQSAHRRSPVAWELAGP